MTDHNGWTKLTIPAIATEDQTYKIGPGAHDTYHRKKDEVLSPAREPRSVLDEIRIGMGSKNFAAQYQQTPVPETGIVIQADWLRYFDDDEEPEQFDLQVASWDTASTLGDRSSYSVGQLWGKKAQNFYLLENIRAKLEWPALRREIIASMENWQPNFTVIEQTELGRAIHQDIWDTTDHRPKLKAVTLDKEARLLAQAARFEAGQVYLPRHAPWLSTYVTELLGFPNEPFDDQVDATSLALDYMVQLTAKKNPWCDATLSGGTSSGGEDEFV